MSVKRIIQVNKIPGHSNYLDGVWLVEMEDNTVWWRSAGHPTEYYCALPDWIDLDLNGKPLNTPREDFPVCARASINTIRRNFVCPFWTEKNTYGQHVHKKCLRMHKEFLAMESL